MKRRLLALLLAAGLLLSLCACGDPAAGSSANPSASPSGDASAAPSQEIEVDLSQDLLPFAAGMEAGDVALTVNGREVTADLFLYWLALNCASMLQYGQYLGMTVADYADALLQDSLSLTAYYVLMEQKAIEEGCPLTDEQWAEVQEQLTANGTQVYENQKRLFNLTDETMEFIFAVTYYYDNLLHALTQDPTEAQLEQYISDNGIFAVKHILLQTTDEEVTNEDGSTTSIEDYNAQQKALAEDLLGQLQASDDMETLFDELMEQYSEDGRNTDGSLASPDGYVFDSTTSLVGGFREAALELDIGELSGVVETDYGYHIMLRGAVDPEEYRSQYRQDQLDGQITQWLEEAQVTPSDAVSGLDVAAFFDRYNAWQSAMAEQLDAESAAQSSASPEPADSAAPVG